MKRLLFSLATAAALWTAACSSGNSVVNPPPPTGKYSLASLSGTYAFVTNGEVITSATVAAPLARVGSFMADGKGGITGGVEDVNEPTVGVTPAISITGGSYTVNADGRGTLTLNLGATSAIDFGIVLTSTSDGLMIDETSNSNQASTGSGNFIRQAAAPFAVSDVAGPYVFDFAGFDVNNNPESFVGEFTASSGVITTGFFDDNDNFTPSSGAMAPGTIAQDSLNPSTLSIFGRGVATIAGQDFVFYIVDSNRVRFLSTTPGMLAGDAVAQSNNIPTAVSNINSSFAFIVAGSSAKGGVTRVGRFSANGSSVSGVLLDTNDSGSFHQTNGNNISAATISLDPVNPGRGTVTFTDSTLSVPFTFVFYLSSATSGVIQDISQSSGVATDVADGSLAAQTGGPFSASNITGTYAFNWSGLSVQGGSFKVQDEEDVVGQATVSNLSLTGAADSFQFQNLVSLPDAVASGPIMPGGNGTGSDGQRNTMSVKLTKSSSITVNFVVYFVNPQLAFFANNQDQNRIVAGVLKVQQ
jgi:hypothetical protein